MSSNASDMKITCKDLIYVGISIPVSLIIFVVGKVYSRATNHNGIFLLMTIELDNEFIIPIEFTLTPWRSFLCSLFPFIMCVYGYKKRSINFSGAVTGIIVAIILTIASPVYLVTLAAFFFSSSKATKYRQDVKKKIEKDFKVGGQRNWVQVLCNGGVGAFIALCHLIECGVGERPIDFDNHYVASWMGKFIRNFFQTLL